MNGRTKGYERYRTLFWRFFKGAIVPEWSILLLLVGALMGILLWGRPGGYLAPALLVLFWMPVQRRTKKRFLKVAPKEVVLDPNRYGEFIRLQGKWCRRRWMGSFFAVGEIAFLTRLIEFLFQGDGPVWKLLAALAVTACIWVWGAASQAHALAVELHRKRRLVIVNLSR